MISCQFNLGANITGTAYGSYLFSIPYFSSGRDSLAVFFGGTYITTTGLGDTPDNYAQLDVAELAWNGGSKDTFVGVAVCDRGDFGITEPWPTNCYYQDFDGFGVGVTDYLDGSVLLSTALGSTANVQDSFQKELQMTGNGTPNVTSAFVLPDIASGHVIYGFSAKWDSEFYYTNVSACGLSFNLSSTANSQILSLPVEAGYGSGLSVDIDIDQSGTPGFFVRLNNSIVASRTFNPDVQWSKANSFRNSFSIDWNSTDGLTFSVNGVPIFTNVPTTGSVPTPGMLFSWAARTSANSEDDNLMMSGIAGVPLGEYYVLASTNLSLPLSQWSILGSNQFDNAGKFAFTNSLNPNAPALFIRLGVPQY